MNELAPEEGGFNGVSYAQVHASELLDNQALLQIAEPGPSVVLGDKYGQEAEVARFFPQAVIKGLPGIQVSRNLPELAFGKFLGCFPDIQLLLI